MTFCGLRFSVCGFPWKTSCDDIPDTFSIDFACLQIAFLFGEKIARRGKGKGEGGGGEPVDKHLRPLFRPLVIILLNISQ